MKSVLLNHRVTTDCEGVTRRDVLKVGTLSFFGLSLPQFLALRSASAATAAPKAEAVILLWCAGGPSHVDTFDPKPDAPSEVRGEFKAIGTNVPGIQLCEHLANTAKVTDKIAIVRSLTSNIAAHEQASQYLMTGYKPLPTLDYPSYGAVVAKELGVRKSMPPYVAIPDVSRAGQAGFIGAGYNAFAVPDPAAPNYQVQDVNPPLRVDDERLARRRGFAGRLNERFVTPLPDSSVRSVDTFYTRAYELIGSSEAKRAFDVSQEPDALREKYGKTTYGQGALLARRLVEAGARFITVSKGGWDTHDNNFRRLSEGGGRGGPRPGRQANTMGLVPEIDQAFAALISDLHDRGMLEKTMVVLMGEFGRTPRVNPRGGRDHYSRCRFATFAGGGVRGGQLVGKSDEQAAVPAERPVSVEDVATTIYSALGIDYEKQYVTPTGRPIHIATGGAPIKELFG
jgi:uncharacterized protein (DUF1501 family)